MSHRTRQAALRAMSTLAMVSAVAMVSMFGMAANAAAQDATKSAAANAPVPTALQTAKRAFIGNAGVDGTSIVLFRKAGDINQPYNWFYAAMKNWGRYELVGNPADADLVFEISFAAPLEGNEKLLSAAPYLRLEIMDAKTHFLLWTIVAPVEGAYRKSTWENNLNAGITSLVSDLKPIAGNAPTNGK